MKRTKETRVLLIALAGSIALHLILSPVLRNIHPAYAATNHRPTPATIFHVHFPPPPPTPKPVVRPGVVSPHTPPRAPIVRRPVVRQPSNAIAYVNSQAKPGAFSAVTSSGAIDAGAPSLGSGLPTEPPSLESPPPRAACSAPDAEARTIQTASLETPLEARQQGATGTAQVEVSLDASGAISSTSIYRSSGWAVLDQAALRAARDSTYRPEERNCAPVAGSYLFTAQFE